MIGNLIKDLRETFDFFRPFFSRHKSSLIFILAGWTWLVCGMTLNLSPGIVILPWVFMLITGILMFFAKQINHDNLRN